MKYIEPPARVKRAAQDGEPRKKKKVRVVTPEPDEDDDSNEDSDDSADEDAEDIVVSHVTSVDVAGIQRDVQRLLKVSTFQPDHQYWLDTGSPELNATLGSREKGLCYGKMIEIYGKNHGGKTTLCQILAACAQRDGAVFGYGDLENSRDGVWSGKLGVSWENAIPIYPKLIMPKAKKKKGVSKPSGTEVDVDEEDNKKTKKTVLPVLQSAEDIFMEAEATMALLYEKGIKKQFWLFDSVANITPSKILDAGIDGQNMNTNVARAKFLADTLPRWAGLAANYNAMIVFINQVRMKIGVMFGDPETTPGGNALLHNCAVRARVGRVKNGLLRKKGKVVGIVFIVKNIKNKAGEGSVQNDMCGVSVRWDREPARIEFMTAEDAERLIKGEI
jgi:RecA/RadA recombinase